MIFSYELHNTWCWRIYLCSVSGSSDFKDILNYYNEHEDTNFKSTLEGDPPCFISDESRRIGIVCVKNWKFDPDHISDLTHELMHLVISISESSSCPVDNHTTECWAYFIDSLMHESLDYLTKRKKN